MYNIYEVDRIFLKRLFEILTESNDRRHKDIVPISQKKRPNVDLCFEMTFFLTKMSRRVKNGFGGQTCQIQCNLQLKLRRTREEDV